MKISIGTAGENGSKAKAQAELETDLPPVRPTDPTRRIHNKKHNSPFIFWDGEGINHQGEGKPQSYVLFGNSEGEYIQGYQLSTLECLDLLLNSAMKHRNSIHVGFGFKYDTEMILADLPKRYWEILKRKGRVRWKGYFLIYHPGKRLTVRRYQGIKTSITLFDIYSFFQMSFVKSLKAWMNAEEIGEIDRVSHGKGRRGDFQYGELETLIKPYWQTELVLGKKLAERLRELLGVAGIIPSQWFGPGAIASTIYKQRSISNYMSRLPEYAYQQRYKTNLPKQVYDAARIAYAGGRFELFKMGHYPEAVYQYDINSAYPAAIATLPDLSEGEWRHIYNPEYNPKAFALWEIEFDVLTKNPKGAQMMMNGAPPLPFFRRDEKSRVSFPYIVNSWVWTPEAYSATKWPGARIKSAWIFEHNGNRPFAFVYDMFQQRREWKQKGEPAEKALKLALNSLYGKMAQRSGWDPDDPDKLPPFFQLEWAGYVTSKTRAILYAAMAKAGLQNIIAAETDAIFSTVPVDLPIGKDLGEWSLELFPYITYLQSGMYFTEGKSKYRGLDQDQLTEAQVMQWLKTGDWDAKIVTYNTRFIGSGRGLGKETHRAWLTEPREIIPGRSGKRIHTPKTCPQCRKRISATEQMHVLNISDIRGGDSVAHSLPWELNPFRKLADSIKYDQWPEDW